MNDRHRQGSENGYYQTPYRDPMSQLSDHHGGAVVVLESALSRANGATWGVVVAAYLATDIQNAGTRRAYARHLRNAGALFGITYMSELTGDDLNDFKAAVVASGLAPASQAQALSALRSFLLWAGSMGKHALSPRMISLALRAPRATVQVRYSVINEKEVAAILANAPSARERAILGVLLGAGLRVAEAAGLQVSDIFEDADGGTMLFVRRGKGAKDRQVPIGPEVDALLRAYLVASGRFLGGDGPLFLANDRGAAGRKKVGLTTRAISRLVGEMAIAAGISARKVTAHSLRHCYAIRCLRAGGNVVAVAKLLGHSSISTTQRYVDHLAVSELRSAVPALPLAGVEGIDAA